MLFNKNTCFVEIKFSIETWILEILMINSMLTLSQIEVNISAS